MTILLARGVFAHLLVALLTQCVGLVAAQSRTSPPPGAVVVRQNTTASEEFPTVMDALNNLPNDTTPQTIFIYPGTYEGQVNVSRSGPLTIYGYTADAHSYASNLVTLIHSASLLTSASDDLTGTLRIHQSNVSIYNINVRNNFGIGAQAIALSNYGSRVGVYGCGLFSYQDTLYASEGTQVYLNSYIEGAVDFIFGRLGQAYFKGNTIASSGYGCVTASGRESNNSAIYVFESNEIVLASNAVSNATGNIWLGRPWADYARVVFKSTYVTAPLNAAIWSQWNPGDPRTSYIIFAEYNTTGPGVPLNASRPSFATTLNATVAATYNVASAVGDDWESWVDTSYLS